MAINEQPVLHIKNSKIGIASFLIGIGMPILIACLFIFSISLDSFLDGYQQRKLNTGFGFFLILAPPVMHLIGLIFGIVGVCQSNRKKLLSVFGIILNSIFLLLGAVAVVLIIMTVYAALGAFH